MLTYDVSEEGVPLSYFVNLTYEFVANGANKNFLATPQYSLEYLKLAKHYNAVASYSKELKQDGILVVCVKNELSNKVMNAKDFLEIYPNLRVDSLLGDFWGLRMVFFNFSMANSLEEYLNSLG